MAACWRWVRAVGLTLITILRERRSSPRNSTKTRLRWRDPKQTTHIRLASADIEHLAFPDNTFDAAVATLVFCSVERPVVGLREMWRVLKPDGKLYLIDHVRSHHAWLGRLQDRLNPRWFAWAEGCNLNRDTESNVRAAGLELISLRVNFLGLVKTMVAAKL